MLCYIKKHFWPAFFALFIFGPIFWWSMDRTPAVVVISSDPIPDPVAPGQQVDFRWNIRIDREGCTSTFIRNTEDDDGRSRPYLPQPSAWTSLPLGHHPTSTTSPYTVPIGVRGRHLKVTLVMDQVCNPVHNLWPIRTVSPPAILGIVPTR